MEQRTWRDRESNMGLSIKPTYRVFFVNFKGLRWFPPRRNSEPTMAYILGSTGGKKRTHPRHQQEVSGSSQPVCLWDKEIQRFRSSSKDHPPRRRADETHVGLTWLGFNYDASMLLDDGEVNLADARAMGPPSLQMTDGCAWFEIVNRFQPDCPGTLLTFHRPEVVPW